MVCKTQSWQQSVGRQTSQLHHTVTYVYIHPIGYFSGEPFHSGEAAPGSSCLCYQSKDLTSLGFWAAEIHFPHCLLLSAPPSICCLLQGWTQSNAPGPDQLRHLEYRIILETKLCILSLECLWDTITMAEKSVQDGQVQRAYLRIKTSFKAEIRILYKHLLHSLKVLCSRL